MELPLTKGFVAIVDAEDYQRVSRHSWCATIAKTGAPYGYSMISGRQMALHRFLIGASPGIETDHVNGNTLDNRRANLRLCTKAENMHNMRSRNGSSIYKGVSWDGRKRNLRRRWRVQILAGGKHLNLGRFISEEEAARVYDAAARAHFREFAAVNFPFPGERCCMTALGAI